MGINKWIALLSRTILRENMVICEKRVLEVKSMHDHVFGVYDVHLFGERSFGDVPLGSGKHLMPFLQLFGA
jgi:hypothetical protein